MIEKNLQNRLIELRKAHSLTQKELGDALFVSDKTISKWETGSSIPDITMINTIATFYKIDVSELIQEENYLSKNDYKKSIYILILTFVISLIIDFLLYLVVKNYFSEFHNELMEIFTSLTFLVELVWGYLVVYCAAIIYFLKKMKKHSINIIMINLDKNLKVSLVAIIAVVLGWAFLPKSIVLLLLFVTVVVVLFLMPFVLFGILFKVVFG